MHAFVINLARSHERRSQMTAQLERTGIGYEFVTAVDGQQLDLADEAVVHPQFLQVAFSAGSAGTALSHLDVYRTIISRGLEAALVLEDDVLVPSDLAVLTDDIGAQLRGAEVVLLNFHSASPCRVSADGSTTLPCGRTLALPIDLARVGSTGAYVITRAACERMVEGVTPIRVLADAWSDFYRDGHLDRVRCVVPLGVDKNAAFASEIGTYALGDGLKGRLLGPLVRANPPGLQQALAYRRRRIFRRWGQWEWTTTPFVERPSRLEAPEIR